MPHAENLISLKEASQISGYSADYIGQLIRAGKIPGKQVYCNIAWVTTAQAVLDYKNDGETKGKNRSGAVGFFSEKRRQIYVGISAFRLFVDTFRSAWSIILAILLAIFLLGIMISYSLFASHNDNTASAKEEAIQIRF